MQRLANQLGGFVQSTSPARVRSRDLWLRTIDGTRVQRLLAENIKPLPTYGDGAFAERPARLPIRRTVGTLFPQTDRLDDRLGSGWAAVALDDLSRGALSHSGLRIADPGADGEWLRRRGLTWALLRPDHYVYACGGPADARSAVIGWRRTAPSQRHEVAA